MAQFIRRVWIHGFKIYFAFCLLTFTLLILLINTTRVFAYEAPPVKTPTPTEKASQPSTDYLPRSLYHWSLNPSDPNRFHETYVEFRGNKMFLKVRF
jgi:hypothetical protein